MDQFLEIFSFFLVMFSEEVSWNLIVLSSTILSLLVWCLLVWSLMLWVMWRLHSRCWRTCIRWLFSLLQAFVDFFSRGLDAEYKSKGIIVQVSENVW